MIAIMPSWISMMVKKDEHDIRPKAGSGNGAARNLGSAAELVDAHSQGIEDARQTVSDTTDQHLKTPWKLLEGGKVVSEKPRYSFILENFKHLAHHRGQLAVYLRMNDAQVPAIYGPSADDHRF